MFFQVDAAQPTVQPEAIFSIGSLTVTNAMMLGACITISVLVFFFVASRRLKLKPTSSQSFLEMMVEAFLGLIEQITGNRKAAEQLLPLIGTIFLFFGISNLITLIPGLASITYNEVPLFRSPTNDFNMTFTIALGIVLLSQVMSIKSFGLFAHLGKYVKIKEVVAGFRQGFGKGLISIIDFAIGLLDVVSELAKVLSLSLRLFGNMYAGEVLAAVLLGAFAFAVPTVWLAMNVLVGVLQAMVFGALSAAYYTQAVKQMEEVTGEALPV
ncbi:MAG: F0F1 ATP synthase subunit A [Candidatus Magasanikbacteria bacterium]|jgi:F-type H+-transporting ATPase subunit a|nr:F0F1 ATP synthase subunit A [Candidatus Magasanikbacteria bacterium]MBT4221380.1 F0F1 ATP synthase subunit A [Candidatus Magasanikbacteria bacterium]MBT4350772.1 F0F1 ATP synthase subunit A [Candidatus Magasanikbacteria bacterium]MBT4541552.1 F0F1 ATP synthase subunit A [Candidatus Magasanikbacteria bacterium]MBT6253504.1 F0F1 ATP synthase subunit A [Candidatus Magasanikbacteria bacterium]